jgi:hypothetical protein
MTRSALGRGRIEEEPFGELLSSSVSEERGGEGRGCGV